MSKYSPVSDASTDKRARFTVISQLADPRPVPLLPVDSTLPQPVAVDALADFDEPGFFLVPVALANGDLNVEVKAWGSITQPLGIRLLWNSNPVSAYHDVTPGEAADPNTVFSFVVPAADMSAADTGQYALQYQTGVPHDTLPIYVNLKNSISTTIIIDRRAPGGELMPTLQFDAGVRDGVTVDDLDANGNLEAVVADYFEMKIADVVTPWIGAADGSAGEYITANEVPVNDDDVGTTKVHILFPRALLEKYGDGPVGFSYKLRDRAGNETADHAPIEVLDVLLKTAPGNLLAPLVPAYDDGLVTNNDTLVPPGVVVQIPYYDNAEEGDIITVHWVGAPPVNLAPYPLSATDIVKDPMVDIPISRAQLVSAGDGNVNVSYTVRRGANAFPDSPATPVVVDMSIPGGPDPDPGTPENENLKPPVITSASGETDLIPKQDYAAAGNKVTIPWQTVDNRQAMRADDLLVVNWGSSTVAAFTLAPDQVSTDLTLTINPLIIPGEGAGLKNVQYSLTRTLSTPPHEASALSPVKEVTVESDVGFPGDGQPLLESTLPEAISQGGFLYIDQSVGLDGTFVRCPLTDTNINAGNTIQLIFVGYRNADGTGAEIPGTRYEPIRIVTPEEMNQGYADFPITAAILLTICDGSVKPTYKVTNSAGTNESNPADVVYIILRDGTPNSCRVVFS